jgi:hypothetical protein
MNDFDALLKRSFAEAHEPADDGFSVHVAHKVAARERAIETRKAVFGVAWAAAGTAMVYGLYGVAGAFGQDVLAAVGLEIARAHGALSNAPSVNTDGLFQSVSAGMVQIMLMTTAALAGGAVAYRATQD